jgi:hypothetical protein
MALRGGFDTATEREVTSPVSNLVTGKVHDFHPLICIAVDPCRAFFTRSDGYPERLL